MQTHSAGTAWILRIVLSLSFITLAVLPWGASPALASAGFDDSSPSFLDLQSPVTIGEGAANGTALWGDYDNDRDLDLFINGIGSGEQPTTILWKNNGGGSFSKVATSLPNLESASAAWGDYDNDNDLDLLILGQASFYGGQINGLARIYRNDSGTFNHLTSAVLPALYRGWGDWGDYDNDGDLDLLLSGNVTGGGVFTGIYRNDGGGQFTDSGIALPGVGFSHSTWGDFDNDYDLDFVLIGMSVTGPIARVYRQSYSTTHGIQFTQFLNLPGMWNGSTNWVDLENDGYMDLMLTGNTAPNLTSPSSPVTRLFHYGSGTFTEINTNLPDIWTSSTVWGDYDNDGDPDLALNGLTTTEQVTRIFRNDGGSVFNEAVVLPRGFGLSLAWGNYDDDANRTLDLAISGQDNKGAYTTQLYRGINVAANQPPAVPVHNSACWDPGTNRLLLDWSSVVDDHTAARGITYALRLGTTKSGTQIISPAANLSNGFRRTAMPGPMFAGSNAMLRGLLYGKYYWSVQAIDSSFTGGQFSAEGTIDYGVEIGVDDSALTIEGIPFSIPVLTNDNQSRGPLQIEFIESPANGTAEIDPANPANILYTPDPGFFGKERFYYHPRNIDKYCSRAYIDITVVPLFPDPPTGITLTPSTITEKMPSGTQVGKFTTQDADNPFDSHTYTFAAGEGSTDNGMFSIKSGALYSKAEFDFEIKSSYSIRIRSTDAGGSWVEKIITVQVTDIMESAPVMLIDGVSAETVSVTMSEDGISAADTPHPFVLTLSASDIDTGDVLSWSILKPAMNGTAQVNPAPTTPGQPISIYYMPEADSTLPDSFEVQVTDSGGLNDTITVNVNILPVNDLPRLEPLITDLSLPEWSGPHVIPVIGISAGPANENETVTLSVSTDRPTMFSDLQVVETGPGTAEIRFKVRAGFAPGRITLTLDDGQPDHNIVQQTIIINPIPAGTHIYIPILGQYP